MLRVVINGATFHRSPKKTILSVLRAAAIEVPALCDDPRLVPIGGCRLCLVEIAGQSRPVAACTTAIADGMQIATHTPLLESLRRTNLRLLARRHPAPHLGDHNSNEFLRWVRAYGVENELRMDVPSAAVDDSHPCIQVDMSRCIHCFRCVRICDEVAGRFVWRAWNRGDRTEIRPANGVLLADSGCVSCGACVDSCPSGALSDRGAIGKADPPAGEIRTVCPYCGTGCEMYVGRRNGHIVSVRPVLNAPVSKGHLCVKGRYGWDFVHAVDRVTEPMIRRSGAWQIVSWDEAIGFIVERLRQIIARHGTDAVGVLGSARATNEENYVTQKFARLAIGTNNVDCCARVCHAPTAAGMKLMLGTGAATNSFDDIEQARTVLLVGVNPTENHPIVGDRIKQAARRGAELIVIDPRRIELVEFAALHLSLRPGTNIPLLNAMAHVIVCERLFDPAIVPGHVENWDQYRPFIAGWPPERAAEICGVSADSIRQAARAYAGKKPAMCFHGLGVTEHVQGTEGVMCLVNLAALTGNLGRPGAGVNPLRGQNNVQGAAHMGCDPGALTGGASLTEHRERFEAAWGSPIPAGRGLNLMQMIDAAGQGQLKALWAIGYDVALTNPNANATLAALRSLELLVVQDLFLTETGRIAGSVFLPACSSFEKDGTFMNSERRIQRVRKVIEPFGQSQSDWEILCRAARAMGQGDRFPYKSSEEIWGEIRAVWPAGAGISYRRIEQRGLQWPCPSEDHPGTTILHTRIFDGDSRIPLRSIDFQPSPEQTTDKFPLLLVTGRALYQFNAGNMTGRSKTGQFQPADRLQVNAADASRIKLAQGQTVRLISRYGEVEIEAAICDAVKPGELFATFQSSRQWVNLVIGPHRDRFVQTPEYKATAVRIEPVG